MKKIKFRDLYYDFDEIVNIMAGELYEGNQVLSVNKEPPETIIALIKKAVPGRGIFAKMPLIEAVTVERFNSKEERDERLNKLLEEFNDCKNGTQEEVE